MPIKSRRLGRFSIGHRLWFTAGVWLGGLLLLTGLLLPKLLNDYLLDNQQSQLSLSMDELIANLSFDQQGKLRLDTPLSDPRYRQPYSGYYWTVSSKRQQLRSRSLWDQTLSHDPRQPALLFGAKGEELSLLQQQVTLPGSRRHYQVIVAMDDAPRQQSIAALSRSLWIILGSLFVGLLLLVGAQLKWSLRPLGRLQYELQRLRQAEQNQIHGHYPQEVAPLVADLNALIFHYQELLQRARQHGGNLSHSLKTPLAVLRNQVDCLAPHQQAEFKAAIEQAQQQIDYHLSRSRMAGAMNILAVKSLPSERLDAMIMAFDKIYAERQLVVVNELEQHLIVAVDEHDLDEMLGNILENAYKWAKGLIRIYAELSAYQLQIVVEDDGPGISPELLPKITQRGYRLDQNDSGSGIGLHIVTEVAHSYRGDLAFANTERGGLKVSLSLPLPPEPV